MTESSDLQRAVDRLTMTIDQLRNELVRKDVYESDQRGIVSRFVVIEKDVVELEAKVDKSDERRSRDRQMVIFSLVVPFLLLLAQIYISSQLGPT